MRIAALIPAYNEEAKIAQVVEAVKRHLPGILVVDDGSKDRTAALAEAAGARVLRHQENKGKGKALANGLDCLFSEGFDAAMCLDSDGQHDPDDIPGFLALAEEADLVIGNRMADVKTMPFARLWTNRTTSFILSRLAGVTVPDTQCGFRLVGKAAWFGGEVKTANFDFEGEMIVHAARKGARVKSAPVKTIYGDEVSKINPFHDTIRFFRMVWRLWREKR